MLNIPLCQEQPSCPTRKSPRATNVTTAEGDKLSFRSCMTVWNYKRSFPLDWMLHKDKKSIHLFFVVLLLYIKTADSTNSGTRGQNYYSILSHVLVSLKKLREGEQVYSYRDFVLVTSLSFIFLFVCSSAF